MSLLVAWLVQLYESSRLRTNLGVVIRDSPLLKYLSFHTYFKDTLSSVTVRKKSEIWHLYLLCRKIDILDASLLLRAEKGHKIIMSIC